ncbi:MAG: autotransporter domain-containing protein [Brevundimonas sp.]|uniref:autotransporter outer membrane beta-barrel domain-containing protein n=1 Tax=Brevundimonas sp. TaxID=1871086 RepID=UPI00391A7025
MRILLATAVAIAPLTIAAGAQAQVVISNARTTPITTANATGTGPDSIRLASGGSIAVTSGTALTVNSNHDVTLDSGSSITMANAADGATGILVQGGSTSNLNISGSILVSDSIETYPDTDGDGDLDGPWATGTGRYGVRVTGPGVVTGDILLSASAAMQVEGNQSYGISVESDLDGRLQSLGTIRVVGDDSIGIRTTGAISGPVNISGPVSVSGANATAISVGGDVGDRLAIQGEISASGYRYTSRGSDEFIAGLDPDDLLQGGPAVRVAANIARGVIVDRPPEAVEGQTDADGDGILDSAEGTGSITSFGAAPAILVGADDRDITLGVAGTGDNAYGFINRGQITGLGVYDEVSPTALRFGAENGGQVAIEGGIRNEGSIAVLSFEADATTIHLAAGANTPTLINTGTISAGASTQTDSRIVNLLIDQGASLTSLENRGSMLATSGGGNASTTSILDLSGSLSSITNFGSLQATLGANEDGTPATGRAVAVDVRANTTGVSFLQDGVLADDDDDSADTDGDGVPDLNEPITIGAILLGSGADTVDIRNGSVVGDIYFGDGADRLSISGGAVVRGGVYSGDGQLDLDISNGRLVATQSEAQSISSLNVGSEGELVVTVDPQAGVANGFDVAGAANIADGATVGVRFNSLVDDPQRFSLIRAGSLNIGALDQNTIQASSPYLFVVEGGADIPAGEVFVDVRRRTADEADLIAVERQAFDSFYQSLYSNEVIRNAFLEQLDRDGFINLYEQMLPDHSGGPLLSLASGVDAVTRALTGRNASAAPGETSAWIQEINFYADKDKTDTYGFRSEGFGFAGGIERGTGYGAIGISTAFTSSDLEDPEAEAEERLSASLFELGLYWRAQGQYWTTWARAAGGYASFDSTRQLVGEGLNLRTESDWHGFTLAAAGGASYERTFGRVNVRPEVYLEYFSLNEDAHTERGGGDGFDLDIDKRDGHLFSAIAAMNVGYGFGENGWLRPELRVGWRQNISVDAGETIARFASGGPDFRLSPATIEGGGPILGFRLNVGNDLGMLSITADAELLEDYVRYSLLLRASFRF